MVEKIAEKSDKAKIITDGARTGCIYVKGSADFKEFGPETVIFASGDFDTDFTQNSLPAIYRPDLLHLPITNGELYNGDAIQVDEVLPTGVPPPGIGGVGFGPSPNLATDHIICELCPPSERGMGLSTNLAYPVSSEKYSGTCVSTDPVAEPAVMSFTVPLTGSTVVAAAAVETTYSESADCTDSSTSMCSGWCSCRNAVCWWKFHSRWCIRFSVGQREAEDGRVHHQLLPVPRGRRVRMHAE